MRPLSWLVLAGAALALLTGAPRADAAAARAMAQGTGAAHHVSYSEWTVNGDTVHLRFIAPTTEARELVAKGDRVDAAAVATAVGAGVSVTSGGGDCPQISQGEWAGKIYTLALTPGLYRYEIIFACPSTDRISLHDGVFFDRDAGHVNYARVQIAGGPPVLQLFTRDHQTLAIPTGANRPPGAGLFSFARQSVARLLRQADRLCAIAGLLLLARRWRDLGEIAAALGVGYLVSLAAALGGLVIPDLGLTGAALGLVVAGLGVGVWRLEATGPPASRGWRIAGAAAAGLIGLGLVVVAALKSPAAGLAAAGLMLFGLAQVWILSLQPRARWLVFAPAAVFGLLDGLGPARDLAMLQLPNSQVAPAFLGYDLGATAAATALAAVGMAMLWLLGRWLRPGRTAAVDVAAAALVGVGLFWYLGRLYG